MDAEPERPPVPDGGLARKVGRSGLLLGARQVLAMLVNAATTAVVARLLGPDDFGVYASATATLFLVMGLADLGFSLMLGRELAKNPEGRGSLVRSTLRTQGLIALLCTIALAGVAIATGLDEPRAQILLVLSPVVLATPFAAIRQVYLVTFRVRFLAAVDVATVLGGSAAILALAAATHDPLITSIGLASMSLTNTAIVAIFGLRLIDAGPARRETYLPILRSTLPLGAASILSSMYFSIDLVLLGWLVGGDALGEYAAAVKFLSILVAVPGLVLATALPGLSMTVHDREALSDLAARVAQWLAVIAVPSAVAVAVFADPLVHVFFGSDYEGSVVLVRLLALSAVVAALSNVMGMLLVALGLTRAQLALNSSALLLNVVGNLLLVPRVGVIASAWLTLLTEVFAGVGAWLLVAPHIRVRVVLQRLWRPLLATCALAAVGLAIPGVPLIAMLGSGLAYLGAVRLLGAWPEEFALRWPWRRSPIAGAAP